MRFSKAIIFIVLIGSSVFTQAQKADDIISKYILFSGGAEKWKAVKTIVMSGTYNYGGMEFPFTSYAKSPNMYKYIVPANGKSFEQAYDGKQGWKIDGFKNETSKTMLQGKAARAMANEADVELESPFVDYKKKGNAVTLEGTDSADGTLCYKIKMLRNDGDTEIYYFNTATFELAEKQAVSKNEELDSSIVNIFYSDYRLTDGIKIPFKSLVKVNDQTILTIIVNKAEINADIRNSEFEP